MFENLDQLIDHNLKEIASQANHSIWFAGLKDLSGKNLKEPERLAEIMYAKGLVGTKGGVVQLTEFGYNVFKAGGWLEYRKVQELHDKKERAEQTLKERTEDLERKKLMHDAKLSKWKVKTFWPVLIVGLFGGLYGIYDTFIKTPSISRDVQELRLSIEQMESELSRSRTSPLGQKNLDSLPIDKNPVDSLSRNEGN